MIGFDEAPAALSQLLVTHLGPEVASGGRILRDIFGRLSFVTERPYDVKLRLAKIDCCSDPRGVGRTKDAIDSFIVRRSEFLL